MELLEVTAELSSVADDAVRLEIDEQQVPVRVRGVTRIVLARAPGDTTA